MEPYGMPALYMPGQRQIPLLSTLLIVKTMFVRVKAFCCVTV